MALLRCADLTLEKGYKFFCISESGASSKTTSTYIPGPSTSTYSGAVQATPTGGGAVRMNGVVTQHTVSTPGVMVNSEWPEITLTATAFDETYAGWPDLLDAAFISKSIRDKYKIK